MSLLIGLIVVVHYVIPVVLMGRLILGNLAEADRMGRILPDSDSEGFTISDLPFTLLALTFWPVWINSVLTYIDDEMKQEIEDAAPWKLYNKD